MTRPAHDVDLLGLVAPFLLWGLGFALLYAGHGLACGLGLDRDWGAAGIRAALSALYALFLGAHAALAYWFWRRWRSGGAPALRFVRLASLVLAVAAIATTAWTGLPVLILSICT